VRELQVSPGEVQGAILLRRGGLAAVLAVRPAPRPSPVRGAGACGVPQFQREASPLRIPPLLTDKVDRVPVQGGEFYNLQFPRITQT